MQKRSALIATDRVQPLPDTCNQHGRIVVAPLKTIWVLGHLTLSLCALIAYFSWSRLAVFLCLTAITVCAGHSVGMHRLLIHRSFKTHRLTLYVLVWLGTLVGMAGPFGMIRAHDIRDWHQRQKTCPPHPSHDARFWQDAWWQLCCEYRLNDPPELVIEDEIKDDPVLHFIERTWMAQQIPLAIVLFVFGGWAWVLWGISLRISVSLIGHWMVGHFAHRQGAQDWWIEGVAVQGFNLTGLGLITAGENWHGNHHAFPHSAKLGVKRGQMDPGFWFVRCLAVFGLAWDIQLPESQPLREGLVAR